MGHQGFGTMIPRTLVMLLECFQEMKDKTMSQTPSQNPPPEDNNILDDNVVVRHASH